MSTDRNDQSKPQPQTAANPEGKPIGNPFENGQPVDADVENSQDAFNSEQAFKEAQTERD